MGDQLKIQSVKHEVVVEAPKELKVKNLASQDNHDSDTDQTLAGSHSRGIRRHFKHGVRRPVVSTPMLRNLPGPHNSLRPGAKVPKVPIHRGRQNRPIPSECSRVARSVQWSGEKNTH